MLAVCPERLRKSRDQQETKTRPEELRHLRAESFVMVKFHSTGGLSAVMGPSVNPELKPLMRGSHGVAKDDCTTV